MWNSCCFLEREENKMMKARERRKGWLLTLSQLEPDESVSCINKKQDD